jgi:hypothetical protein
MIGRSFPSFRPSCTIHLQNQFADICGTRYGTGVYVEFYRVNLISVCVGMIVSLIGMKSISLHKRVRLTNISVGPKI